VKPSFKDRHLFGAGAAACAVCCAAPVLTLLGVVGVAATMATFVFAGLVFGLVVAAGALAAVLRQRRGRARQSSAGPQGPVDVELSTALGAALRERRQSVLSSTDPSDSPTLTG
jgi:hypothetical protein